MCLHLVKEEMMSKSEGEGLKRLSLLVLKEGWGSGIINKIKYSEKKKCDWEIKNYEKEGFGFDCWTGDAVVF